MGNTEQQHDSKRVEAETPVASRAAPTLHLCAQRQNCLGDSQEGGENANPKKLPENKHGKKKPDTDAMARVLEDRLRSHRFLNLDTDLTEAVLTHMLKVKLRQEPEHTSQRRKPSSTNLED